MAYTTSKTDWDEDYELTTDEQNRIEANIKALAEEAMTITGNKTFSGNNTHSGDNQFTGNNEFTGDNILSTNALQFKHILFTGTTNAFGHASISSGIDYNKILDIRCYYYVAPDWLLLVTAKAGDEVEENAIRNTGVIACGGSSISANKPFRCFVTYEI